MTNRTKEEIISDAALNYIEAVGKELLERRRAVLPSGHSRGDEGDLHIEALIAKAVADVAAARYELFRVARYLR